MWRSTCVILRVGESQQTTQYQESLPVSAQIAYTESGSTVPVPEPRHLQEGKICSQIPPSPNKEEETGVALEKVENERAEEGREGDHADTKGHCRCEKGQRPSCSTDSQSFDVISDDFAMDMLNKLEKRGLSDEETLVDCHPRPIISNEFHQVYASGIVYLPLENGNSVSVDAEDPASTRHSSGCDDSGVFLEDLPYTPENPAPTIIENQGNLTDNFKNRTHLSPDMREYSIDAQCPDDSDAERSDDLGLASSSVDSADDLDGDPLPSKLQIEPTSPLNRKPPPVPPRKSLGNGHYISQKEFVLMTNGVLHDKTASIPTSPMVYTVSNIENEVIPSQNIPNATRMHSEGFKWKSEECLRPVIETKWSQKHDKKAVSVKDRIAMFSELEIVPSVESLNKKDLPLQRHPSENMPSVEAPEIKTEHNSREAPNISESFPSLSRDTKWYSMYSLPVTSSAATPESKSDVVELKITCSSSPLVPTTSTPHEKVNRYTGSESSNGISALKVDTEIHQRYPDKPVISSYPQTQLANNKRYSYGRYSLNPIRTTDDLLSKKNNGLLSIIDSRKQSLVKLKGLVIPDSPRQLPPSKALPTIVSNDSLILNSKTDVDIEKDIKRSMLSAASYKTMSLPRTRNEIKAKLEPVSYDVSKFAPEPSWKSSSTNPKSNLLPKYSPSFNVRTTLDLPNAVSSSLSPTPPSSITSPLSPPPSSPSSICSSNASSATSVATMQQNIFQFSLSHSKPVTPVLPEKPIMSPPSLPSDIEYEGDNSEDSSTSASPMTAKISSSSSKLLGTSSRHEKSPESFGNVSTDIHYSNDSDSSTWDTPKRSSLGTRSDDHSFVQGKPENTDKQARQQFLSSVNKSPNIDYRSDDRLQEPYRKIENGKSDYFETKTISCAINSSATPDTTDAYTGRRNIFSAMSQDVQSVKFRAQPLTLNQVVRNGSSTGSSNPTVIKTLSNENSVNRSDLHNSCDVTNGRLQNNDSKSCISDYGYDKQPWSRSSDVMQFKKDKLDSEEEDDSHSSLSHRTEDSRPTTDDYLSDATTDSFDKSFDPDLRPRRLSQQKVVLKASAENTDSVQKFKALASKWEQRADVTSPPPPPPPLLPAPRKEQKPYSGSIPPTSSFLTSVINCTSSFPSNGNNSTSLASASLKLPPSLMPRNKHSSHQNDLKIQTNRTSAFSQNISDQKYASFPYGKDSRTVYESVWAEDRSRRSSISGLREFSDSGSGTDTGSVHSKKIFVDSQSEKTAINCIKDNDIFNTSLNEWKDPVTTTSSCTTKVNLSMDYEAVPPSEDEVFKEVKNSVDAGSLLYNNPPESAKDTSSSAVLSDLCTSSIVGKISTEESFPMNNGLHGTPADHSSRRVQSGCRTQPDGSWRSESTLDLTTRRNSGREFQSSDFLAARALSKSQASLRDPLLSVRSQASSYFSSRNSKSVSVSDIRKAFEYQTLQNQALASKPPPLPPRNSESHPAVVLRKNSTPRVSSISPNHKRLSSMDSTTSGDSGQVSPVRYGSVGSLTSISRDPYGSITSLASTTSLISPQELQLLIDEANQSIDEESKDPSNQEIQVIVLHREVPSGSIGITLAGGADYEVKEITVHKVICGSLADRDGRLRKGDRVISINGRPLRGTTHREALDILKAPRPEVVIVISREKLEANGQSNGIHHSHHNGDTNMISNGQSRAKDHFRKMRDGPSLSSNGSLDDTSTANIVCVHLQKDITGLGFSIEGGKDSPQGDRPLVIKRIFKGGVADKEGKLQVGDEIISVNGQSVTSMTRTEAWNFLKKLPEEPILLRARKSVGCAS